MVQWPTIYSDWQCKMRQNNNWANFCLSNSGAFSCYSHLASIDLLFPDKCLSKLPLEFIEIQLQSVTSLTCKTRLCSTDTKQHAEFIWEFFVQPSKNLIQLLSRRLQTSLAPSNTPYFSVFLLLFKVSNLQPWAIKSIKYLQYLHLIV